MKKKRIIQKTKVAKIRTVEPEVLEPVEKELYSTIRGILAKARATAYVTVNTVMVEAYWNIGREIVEKQGGMGKAKYGDHLIDGLSERLTAEFGPGFTRVNLFYMRRFYLAFPNVHTLCKQLSWSHYRALISIESETARQYYLNECVKSHWSVRLLQRQIDTEFYERLIANMRMFLMELGRGFCLEAEQKQLQIGGENYYCDLVFYNYIARCFFLIDLKVGKVTSQDIGQMQLYKHYYEREMMRPGDNPPVGIVLGSSTDSAIVKYTLNEHERNLFAVRYHLHLPTVEELQRELLRERAAIEEAMSMRETGARIATAT